MLSIQAETEFEATLEAAAAGFFQGDLARAGVIGRYLQASERHALAVVLGAKYGVTIP